MKPRVALAIGLTAVGGVLALAACATPTPTPEPEVTFNMAMLSQFGTLPEEATPTGYELTQEIVDLGRMLYYEPRLSVNGQMSCNTCHPLNTYGMDGLRFSFGHAGDPVGRNSPTSYNAALHVAQFWDGRAADVEAQAKGPILAGGEMGMPNSDFVVGVLKEIPGYLPLFEAAFPDDTDPINYDNVGTAIGAFERKLITPGRFDLLLAGDESAFNDAEKRGLALFVSTGCASCHTGPLLGGTMYAKLGAAESFAGSDLGRFNVTGDEADKYVFKVPSLRNIGQTGPYLHDGSIPTLEDMVRIMVRHQLGKELEDNEINDMVLFLRSLTGEVPADYIARPELP
ncbi:MAG TPA: cytochrome c peroxidase [Anaerolineales bacterium]|nr:cytochrome c peroxidase [Anaerolineales bacterium]